jgi:predicted dehydrogenase
MVEQDHPDLISIALPSEAHFEPTLRLLRTGIPLFVEKPLVFDMAEADILLAQAERSNNFFAINFNHRYADPVQRPRPVIDANGLGAPVFATWRSGGEASRGSSPHMNLIETQCHGFDMLEYLVGPIGSVMAQMANMTYGAYSTVALALEFANGAVGTLLGTYDASFAYPEMQRLEINGAAGRILIRDAVQSFRCGSAPPCQWEVG